MLPFVVRCPRTEKICHLRHRLVHGSRYGQQLGILDTIYNLAVGGTTTYAGMPTGYTPPPSRAAPSTSTTITAALSHNPDVVIIAYASNDAADGFTIAESMSNLRTMYQTVIDAGKIAYVTTSQP